MTAAPGPQQPAPIPPVPDSDRWRQQIAEVLNVQGACCGDCGREPGQPLEDCPDCARYLGCYATALLPLIAQARAEGAAEALEPVLSLHRRVHTLKDQDRWLCEVCIEPHPCPTARAALHRAPAPSGEENERG